ncbi:MAG: hypothetical protein R3240_05345 [Gammaproteobacteria bacterium]|nr:hypothetical protein [Gammaproteobacteria bacterium]
MDQAFKENLHGFMMGLEIVLFVGVAAIFAFYFFIKYKTRKKRENNDA